MKFRVDLKDFADALHYVTGVIERKFTYPILQNVLVTAENGTVVLRATDHDMSLLAVIGSAEIQEEGRTTIEGRKSLDVVSAIAGGSELEMETTPAAARMKVGRSVFLLATMAADGFPPDTTLADPVEISISTEQFLHMLRSVATSMAQSDLRRHLNGALLELSSTHIRTVATDGMIMCVCTKDEPKSGTDSVVEALIPRKAVQEIVRGFAVETGTLKLGLGTNALSIEGEQRTLITNLIQTKFPAYAPVIPAESDVVMKCDRDSLLRAITAAAPLSDEGNKIFLEANRDMLKVTATTEVGDRAEVEVPVDFGENSTNVIFRHDRIRNILTTFECEEVSFHIPSPTESVRVDSSEQGDLLFVVSPIRG